MNVKERFQQEVCEKCDNKQCKRKKKTMVGCAVLATYFDVKDFLAKFSRNLKDL